MGMTTQSGRVNVGSMTSTNLDRIVELWPSLPREAQARLVKLAEREAVYAALDLTPEDEVSLAKARADFAGRRTVTLSECDADLDAYFAATRAKASAP
jgi:hypothetical protein